MLRIIALTGLAVLVIGGPVSAQDQSYGSWARSADGRWYCSYFYKSNSGDSSYKKQYVFYDPKDPCWVYWANPKDNPDNKSGKDKYWARCPTKAHPKLGQLVKEGKDVWSLLPDDKKPSRFADLNDGDFPPSTISCPPIPGQKDPKRT